MTTPRPGLAPVEKSNEIVPQRVADWRQMKLKPGPGNEDARLTRMLDQMTDIRDTYTPRLRALAALTPDGYTTGSDAEHVTVKGDPTDPTGDTTAQGERNRARAATITVQLAETAAHLTVLWRMVTNLPTPMVNVADEVAKARCTGGTGDWADPTCERLAVYSADHPAGPVCHQCYKRWKRRHDNQRGAA